MGKPDRYQKKLPREVCHVCKQLLSIEDKALQAKLEFQNVHFRMSGEKTCSRCAEDMGSKISRDPIPKDENDEDVWFESLLDAETDETDHLEDGKDDE